MFKRVDPSRPWGETGQSSATWLQVHPRLFYIEDLVATQDGVLLHALARDYSGEPVGLDPYPHVVEWRGELFLEDGHHRAMRALMRGERAIEARYLKLRR